MMSERVEIQELKPPRPPEEIYLGWPFYDDEQITYYRKPDREEIEQLEAENAELIAIIEKLMVACEALPDAPDGYIEACFATSRARGEWGVEQ